MPYALGLIFRDGKPMTYDSGDYPKCQEEALRLGDYEGFRHRQEQARAEGRHIGIGIANYVEGTGLGPFEGATVRIQPSGQICIYTGGGDSGQGHWTTLAQVCADKFGVGVETEHETTFFEGVISGPISDNFLARLAFGTSETDELRENYSFGNDPMPYGNGTKPFFGEESSNARLTLLWTPTETLTAKLKYQYSKYEN